MQLKLKLQSIGLDLAILYGEPQTIFQNLKVHYDEILCSCDFDSYAIERDKSIEKIQTAYKNLIFRLRKKFGNDFIKTIPNMGYKVELIQEYST